MTQTQTTTATQTTTSPELAHKDAALTALEAAHPAPKWDKADSYDVFDKKRQAQEAALLAIVPEVGMGATIQLYTDSHACTVIAVSKSGNQVTVRRDTAKLVNGFNSGAEDALTFSPGGFCGHTSGDQRYVYTTDPEGSTQRFSRRVFKTRLGVERITWVRVGDSAKGGTKLTLGVRHEHYDFNF